MVLAPHDEEAEAVGGPRGDEALPLGVHGLVKFLEDEGPLFRSEQAVDASGRPAVGERKAQRRDPDL